MRAVAVGYNKKHTNVKVLHLLMQEAGFAIEALWYHIEMNREAMGKNWKISYEDHETWECILLLSYRYFY